MVCVNWIGVNCLSCVAAQQQSLSFHTYWVTLSLVGTSYLPLRCDNCIISVCPFTNTPSKTSYPSQNHSPAPPPHCDRVGDARQYKNFKLEQLALKQRRNFWRAQPADRSSYGHAGCPHSPLAARVLRGIRFGCSARLTDRMDEVQRLKEELARREAQIRTLQRYIPTKWYKTLFSSYSGTRCCRWRFGCLMLVFVCLLNLGDTASVCCNTNCSPRALVIENCRNTRI